MRKRFRGFEISIVIFTIYLVSSFAPVLQIYLGYLNGLLVYLFEQGVAIPSRVGIYLINLVGTIFFGFRYYRSVKLGIRILMGSLTSFFLFGLILFSFEQAFSDEIPYWVEFVFNTLVVGACLIMIDFVKLACKRSSNA